MGIDEAVTIVVAPQSDSDPRPDELRSLARAIADAVGVETEVRASPIPPPGIAQVTLWEVVTTTLPPELVRDAVVAAVLSAIASVFKGWAKSRFAAGNVRPKLGKILGPDGRLLKEVRLERADGQLDDAIAGNKDSQRRQG